MSVKIRLRRTGASKQPSYRIVITDSRAPRDGRFIESIGHYNPRRDPIELVIDHDKARDWLQRGAVPTESVYRLFALQGLPSRPRSSLRRVGRPAEQATTAVVVEE